MKTQLKKRMQLGTLAALRAAAAAGATIATAPVSAAAPPLLPNCEQTGGGGGMQGGMTIDCASPSNVQIDSTPPVYWPMNQWDMGFGGFMW
jgi:Spy/CpxP family protein refolding chaperone